ncbi:MAG: leucine zipper domain-containing protein [Candidatus Goldbacteria bacterium]|nr:leucine zipper domain-containing protein [Candidatus Goldiibacteriota bacterium]
MYEMEYYTMMLNCKNKKLLRMKMIMHVKEYNNIAFTAKVFNTTRKTVYKWLKRYTEKGYEGLLDLSKRPKHCPKETPKELKEKIIAAKKKYKSLGAKQVNILANLYCLLYTIYIRLGRSFLY